MKPWLVISYLPNDGDVVFDTILAATSDKAEEEVLRVRGIETRVSAVEAPEDFLRSAQSWANETLDQTRESWALTCEALGVEAITNA